MSSNLIRWGALGALLAAIGWTVSGIVALGYALWSRQGDPVQLAQVEEREA